MEQLRLLLAIFAALLALVFLGVWWVRGRQRSTKGRTAVVLYAILLLCSSAFLYSRSQNEAVKQTVSRELVPEKQVKVETQKVPTTSVVDSAKDVRTIPETEQTTKFESTKSTQKSEASTPSVIQSQAKAKPHFIGPPMLELPKRKRSSPTEPVEIVEAAVLQAFDIIELFFDKYAAPTTAAASSTTTNSIGKIEFVPGTAELSERSLNYLRSLAPELSKIYKDGHLEIRAQSDESVNSPAQRYMLTQSRAETVRDILAAEGFPPNRLVPVGSETVGVTRVKFVHRPN